MRKRKGAVKLTTPFYWPYFYNNSHTINLINLINKPITTITTAAITNIIAANKNNNFNILSFLLFFI